MQHSRYQEDALGRLAGTTQWLTVVTFGDRASADRECARVRGMHRRVVGTYPTEDGQRAYSASDPDLLRWVHIAFTDSFLATHRVWGGPIPGGEDEYVREWAKAGELVGVENPPRSVAELRRQIAEYGPVLRGDEAARSTARFIRNVPVPRAGRPAYAVLFAGAVSTLPLDQRRMLGVPDLPLTVTRPAVAGILGTMAKVLGPMSPSLQAAHARIDLLSEQVQAPPHS
jgi:uncharacterized protein (DUF2236 family)